LGVGTSHRHLDSLDSPRPGLRGSHHLPPYSILCSSMQRLHPNGSFSRDSQGGVLKVSQLGLPGLWAFITSRPKLRSWQGLNKSYNFPRELSNAMSHSCCRRWKEVDSRLLVVGSQTASLTPGRSFAHNLGYRRPNGSCEAILDIYISRPFQWDKEHPNARCFDPKIRALSFQESRETPTSHFRECGLHPHTYPKVGLRQLPWECVMWLLGFLLARPLASPCFGHEPKAKVVTQTIMLFQHDALVQFMCSRLSCMLSSMDYFEANFVTFMF
jgi:hypothetical protein